MKYCVKNVIDIVLLVLKSICRARREIKENSTVVRLLPACVRNAKPFAKKCVAVTF